jgi:hypothetical protein
MESKNVTFVVGAGAVENSWQPVITAINKTLEIEIDGDGANFLFAKNIYLMRFYAKFASRGIYKNHITRVKENISLLKENISIELKIAEKNNLIKPHKEFKAIVKKFISSNIDKAFLVTTNWDEVIDNEVNKLYHSNYPKPNSIIQSLHIHGSINSPNGLYLPSEITQEMYRTSEEEKKMGKNHGLFISLLEKGNRTILYGISLDPLDAELNHALSVGWKSKENEEIIIIDINHEKVAKRVKLLLEKRSQVKVVGYHPEDLTNEINYV